ncbi:MAG: hypothetical protein NTX03_05885 [Bacteroidetes bacterium]|nr:hypothetical protein [Bacteroidota bacterium]
MPEIPAKKKKTSNTPKRTYSTGDGELYRRAKMLVISLREDKDLLAGYAITDAKIDALESLNNEFSEILMDEAFVGQRMQKKSSRDARRNEMYKAMLELKLKIEDKWEAEPDVVAEFCLGGNLSRLKPEELYEVAKVTADALDTHAADLGAPYHVDAAYVAGFHAKVEALKNALTEFKKKQSKRNGKTIERITMGNKLHKEMQKFGKIGKAYWALNNNYSRYSEYVIGERRGKKKEENP